MGLRFHGVGMSKNVGRFADFVEQGVGKYLVDQGSLWECLAKNIGSFGVSLS